MWHSGLLPKHDQVHGIETSGTHTDFHNNLLESSIVAYQTVTPLTSSVVGNFRSGPTVSGMDSPVFVNQAALDSKTTVLGFETPQGATLFVSAASAQTNVGSTLASQPSGDLTYHLGDFGGLAVWQIYSNLDGSLQHAGFADNGNGNGPQFLINPGAMSADGSVFIFNTEDTILAQNTLWSVTSAGVLSHRTPSTVDLTAQTVMSVGSTQVAIVEHVVSTIITFQAYDVTPGGNFGNLLGTLAYPFPYGGGGQALRFATDTSANLYVYESFSASVAIYSNVTSFSGQSPDHVLYLGVNTSGVSNLIVDPATNKLLVVYFDRVHVIDLNTFTVLAPCPFETPFNAVVGLFVRAFAVNGGLAIAGSDGVTSYVNLYGRYPYSLRGRQLLIGRPYGATWSSHNNQIIVLESELNVTAQIEWIGPGANDSKLVSRTYDSISSQLTQTTVIESSSLGLSIDQIAYGSPTLLLYSNLASGVQYLAQLNDSGSLTNSVVVSLATGQSTYRGPQYGVNGQLPSQSYNPSTGALYTVARQGTGEHVQALSISGALGGTITYDDSQFVLNGLACDPDTNNVFLSLCNNLTSVIQQYNSVSFGTSKSSPDVIYDLTPIIPSSSVSNIYWSTVQSALFVEFTNQPFTVFNRAALGKLAVPSGSFGFVYLTNAYPDTLVPSMRARLAPNRSSSKFAAPVDDSNHAVIEALFVDGATLGFPATGVISPRNVVDISWGTSDQQVAIASVLSSSTQLGWFDVEQPLFHSQGYQYRNAGNTIVSFDEGLLVVDQVTGHAFLPQTAVISDSMTLSTTLSFTEGLLASDSIREFTRYRPSLFKFVGSRSGTLPYHDPFFPMQTSGAHSNFHSCLLESNLAYQSVSPLASGFHTQGYQLLMFVALTSSVSFSENLLLVDPASTIPYKMFSESLVLEEEMFSNPYPLLQSSLLSDTFALNIYKQFTETLVLGETASARSILPDNVRPLISDTLVQSVTLKFEEHLLESDPFTALPTGLNIVVDSYYGVSIDVGQDGNVFPGIKIEVGTPGEVVAGVELPIMAYTLVAVTNATSVSNAFQPTLVINGQTVFQGATNPPPLSASNTSIYLKYLSDGVIEVLD